MPGVIAELAMDWNGNLRSGENVHAMSLANLDAEYCTVITAETLWV